MKKKKKKVIFITALAREKIEPSCVSSCLFASTCPFYLSFRVTQGVADSPLMNFYISKVS